MSCLNPLYNDSPLGGFEVCGEVYCSNDTVDGVNVFPSLFV